MGCYHIQHLSHPQVKLRYYSTRGKNSLWKKEICKNGKRLSRPHKFFAPPMSNGVAGGAAATSKGKSGGRMVGEEKQEKKRQEGDGEGRRKGGKIEMIRMKSAPPNSSFPVNYKSLFGKWHQSDHHQT